MAKRSGARRCSIEGCDNPHDARGWCTTHYARWKKNGSPLVVKRIHKHGTERERLAAAHAAKVRWRLANPEKMAAAREGWADRNIERRRAHRRRAKKNNPVANRAAVQRRKAILRGVATTAFTAEEANARWDYFGGNCWLCGGPASSLDHVKPLSKGGAHMLCNLRPACVPCNSRKHAKWPYPTTTKREAQDALRPSLALDDARLAV